MSSMPVSSLLSSGIVRPLSPHAHATADTSNTNHDSHPASHLQPLLISPLASTTSTTASNHAILHATQLAIATATPTPGNSSSTNLPHLLVTATPMSTTAAATATPLLSATAVAISNGNTPTAATPDLLADLVRKVASFRRGLVQERKEKKLLELSLEEALLQQNHLTSLQREQDVQLLTALELAAKLEHALHMNSIEPLQSHELQEKELDSIFAKPKREMENEIKRLFSELSTIQQYYHALEKRSLEDKMSYESSHLKLNRDLKVCMDQLDKSMKESRKYKSKCQELLSEAAETREELAKIRKEKEQGEHSAKEELERLNAQALNKDEVITKLQRELDEQKKINEALAKRATLLSDKVESLELTVRHFTCTRIIPHSATNVTCRISIKKIPLTGEVVLCIKDIGSRILSGDAAAATSGISAVSNAVASTPSLHEIDLSHEYQQDISTVRCRAVDQEQVQSMMSEEHDDQHENDTVPLSALLSATTNSSSQASSFNHVTANGTSSSSSLSGLPDASVLLGFRPRFLLCFSADNNRCLIFETDSHEFRRNICHTLQQFVRMVKDPYVDELGGFFGDVRGAGE